jgi:hypothetical protein
MNTIDMRTLIKALSALQAADVALNAAISGAPIQNLGRLSGQVTGARIVLESVIEHFGTVEVRQ